VLRFSVDLFEYLLYERDNVKVIHLFRDPRAVINSEINAHWYKHTHNIELNARSLCKKMLHDYIEGRVLLSRYPSKFMFLYYEDLTDNALDKVKALYKYIGMSESPEKIERLKALSVFSDKSLRSDGKNSTAFWWRNQLSWDIVQKVDKECSSVINLLGYKLFSTENQLKDLSIPSIDIPSQYRVATEADMGTEN